MDNKLNNMLQSFFDENEDLSEEELNKKLGEFMMKYNSGNIDYEETDLDKAYELLDKASEQEDEKKARKYAKEALKVCPYCFDAKMFLIDLEEDLDKVHQMLDEALKDEKERLTNEGFFDKENIGHFYGLFETRPYIGGLYRKAELFFREGRLSLAKDVCKEILKLNKNDNLGARYTLMATLVMLEDEKEMLKVYKKYPEENLEMLIPLMVLYYKLDDFSKAKDYLVKINKANNNFKEIFNGKMEDLSEFDGYYQRGEISEIQMYVMNYFQVFLTVPSIVQFVQKNI